VRRSLNAAKCLIQNPFPSPHPANNKAKFGGVNSMSGETVKSWLNICKYGGSVAEWLACGTQALKGPGSNRSRDVVG